MRPNSRNTRRGRHVCVQLASCVHPGCRAPACASQQRRTQASERTGHDGMRTICCVHLHVCACIARSRAIIHERRRVEVRDGVHNTPRSAMLNTAPSLAKKKTDRVATCASTRKDCMVSSIGTAGARCGGRHASGGSAYHPRARGGLLCLVHAAQRAMCACMCVPH